MKKPLKYLIKYGITILIGAAMSFAVIYLHGFAAAETLVEKYRILSDAFTIPGVVISLVAVLVMISNQGAFDGIAYSLSYLVRSLIPFGRTGKEHETYRDYIERKKKNGKIHGYGFILITGLAFLAVAIVFLILFYKEFNAM